jgi:histone deacetylase 11
MARVVYSRHYNIGFLGLERLHPFDSRKYGRAWRLLRKRMGQSLRTCHVSPPRPANRADLLKVHTEDYLQELRAPAYVAGALEIPQVRRAPSFLLDKCVLRPMRWATMGSAIAAREALASGFAVNLSGGYHHAKPSAGEGFCIYSDIALLVHELRAGGLLTEDDLVAYVDLDAHQGNGVCHAFMSDPRVGIFDMYNAMIFPAYDVQAIERIDCNRPLMPGCDGDSYLSVLRNDLPAFLGELAKVGRIGLVIYNAGTDVLRGDPLGDMSLSAENVADRDIFVVKTARDRHLPVVMLLSGGYTRVSYRLVADSVQALIERFDSTGGL